MEEKLYKTSFFFLKEMCVDPLKLNPQAFVARLCSPICFFVSVCKRSQSNSNHGSCFSSSTAVELSRPNAYQLLTRCQDSCKGQAAWAWLCSWFRSKGMRKQNHEVFLSLAAFTFSNTHFQPCGFGGFACVRAAVSWSLRAALLQRDV